jgi:hypothetical protein
MFVEVMHHAYVSDAVTGHTFVRQVRQNDLCFSDEVIGYSCLRET